MFNIIIPWAVLAMAPLAQARLDRPWIQNGTMQCCPCPTGGMGQNRTTVTVTATQPQETVTVIEYETTVYVTQIITSTPSTVTQVVTVLPQPPREKVIVFDKSPNNSESPSGPEPPKTVTETTQLDGGEQGSEQGGPKTVTLNVSPAQDKTVTVINSAEPSLAGQTPEGATVTITVNPEPSAPGPSRPNDGQGAVTKTVTVASQPKDRYTVLASAQSSIKVVPFVENDPNTEVKTAPQATVTSPPQTETVLQTVDHYATLTKTVSSGGSNNIEIIIINIITGDIVCRKEGSGEPCDAEPYRKELQPSTTPCLSTGVLTKTATAFNTVVVTVSHGLGFNGTGPSQPSGTGSVEARKLRVPKVRKWL